MELKTPNYNVSWKHLLEKALLAMGFR